MTELRIILRWLRRAALLQSTVIFLVYLALTARLSTVSTGLRVDLYRSQVASQQVVLVDRGFSSISSISFWTFLVGVASTCVGYGLLRRLIIGKWPSGTAEHKGQTSSELISDSFTTSKNLDHPDQSG